MESDLLEAGLQQLSIPSWWEVEAVLKARRHQKPPSRRRPTTETAIPEDWKATLSVFLPQR